MRRLFVPRPRPRHRLERPSRPNRFALVALLVLGLSLAGNVVGFDGGAAVGTPRSVVPTRALAEVATAQCSPSGSPPTRTTTHVVRAGENLSRIARAELGSGRLWNTIYRRNRSLIGPNPNLIRPGQTLVVPHTKSSACTGVGPGNEVEPPSPHPTATTTAPPTAVPSVTSSAVTVPSGTATPTREPTDVASTTPEVTPSSSTGDQTVAPVTVPVTTPGSSPSTAVIAPTQRTTGGDSGSHHSASTASRVATWLAVAAGGSALVGGAIFLLGRRRKTARLSDADRLVLGIRDQMARDSAQWPTRADYEALRTVRKQVPPIAGYRDGDTVYVKNATMGKLVGALHIDRAGALRELWERGDLTVQESRRARGEWSVQSRLLRSTAYAVKLPTS